VDSVMVWIGRAAGVVGAAIVGAAALVRLSGTYWLGGFQAGTVFLAGIACLTFGCFCMLIALTQRRA